MLPLRHAHRFPSTNWTLVLATRQRSHAHAREPVAELCSLYWYPVYAYLRRRGHRADAAEDLTQGFFTHVLARKLLERADRQKGRLRAFLLASLTNFVACERERSHAQKRGGATLAWADLDDAETRYRLEPVDEITPERLYERRWAAALLDRVLRQLRAEFARTGRVRVFDALKSHLTGEPSEVAYREASGALHLSDGAVRVAAHRLRRRYRELLRAEIARTVADPATEVDDEIRYLFDVTH
jgi:RNA polymerase sigma-70 factor (ECF subfamily)